MHRTVAICGAILGLGMGVALAAAAGDFVTSAMADEARGLIQAGKPAQAYALLREAEPAYAGDPDFDYLFGVAALDAGHADEAQFALRRAVMTRPRLVGARVDLARAQFEAGDLYAAREELKQIQALNPPPGVAEVVDAYLEAIRERESRHRRSVTALVQAEGGYDSNANSGTDALSFQNFRLDDRSRGTESPYFGTAIEGDYVGVLRPRLRWLAGAGARLREYPDAEFVNNLNLGARTGLRYVVGKRRLDAVVSAGQQRLDGREDNSVTALRIESRSLNERASNHFIALRLAAIRYDDVPLRDVDQLLLSAGMNWPVRVARGGLVTVGALLGHDESSDDSSPNGRDLFGLNASLSTMLRPGMRLDLSAAGVLSDYDGPYVFSDGNDRSDEYAELGVELALAPSRFRGWMLGISARHIRNESDITLFGYDRTDFALRIGRRLR